MKVKELISELEKHPADCLVRLELCAQWPIIANPDNHSIDVYGHDLLVSKMSNSYYVDIMSTINRYDIMCDL